MMANMGGGRERRKKRGGEEKGGRGGGEGEGGKLDKRYGLSFHWLYPLCHVRYFVCLFLCDRSHASQASFELTR